MPRMTGGYAFDGATGKSYDGKVAQIDPPDIRAALMNGWVMDDPGVQAPPDPTVPLKAQIAELEDRIAKLEAGK